MNAHGPAPVHMPRNTWFEYSAAQSAGDVHAWAAVLVNVIVYGAATGSPPNSPEKCVTATNTEPAGRYVSVMFSGSTYQLRPSRRPLASNASTSKSSPASNDRSIVKPWPAVAVSWNQSASLPGTSHALPVKTTGAPTAPTTSRPACGP